MREHPLRLNVTMLLEKGKNNESPYPRIGAFLITAESRGHLAMRR